MPDDPPVALVTGAARRVGAVIAQELHAAGYRVGVHYHRSAAAAEALIASLNAARADSAFGVKQDLAVADAAPAVVAALRRHTARLDVLVNNASVFEQQPIGDDTPANWDRVLGINARSPYFLALESAALLRAARGCVINITDIHASRPRADYAAYCISKAALVGVTQALAVALAPDIRVNAVAPGAILWAASENDELQARALAATALGHPGTPGDIAGAVLYLARAPYVTGQVVAVDGGRLLNV